MQAHFFRESPDPFQGFGHGRLPDDKCAAPSSAVDHAVLFQIQNGLSGSDPGDAVHLLNLGFTFYLVTGLQVTFQDPAPVYVLDLDIQRLGTLP